MITTELFLIAMAVIFSLPWLVMLFISVPCLPASAS